MIGIVAGRGWVALGGLIAALLFAAPAAADSLVFIRANNVWLANADGSGQYQVTRDGTSSSPYSSPSQADDGTIVALRRPLGGRPQIWRMHQNGGLLNAPVNTPAPGTGAIDARVSPNGQLVAYWFVTETNDPLCPFCINLASRALISHSDRFTPPTEVGTPNTGSLPSWMSNDSLLLSNGNATQWYYKLGMIEAVEWWGDSQNCGACIPPAIVGLTDGEVSRDGQRIALVRGDNNETITLYKTTGPPPTALPTPTCEFTGAVGGKFSGPTWSQDGATLAWQEGNGIWSAQVPDISNCTTISQSKLVVAGGAEADFGPAPVNPGKRPACGNPGNPSACPPPPPPPPKRVVNLKQSLRALLANGAGAFSRLAIHGLLKHQIKLSFSAPGSGTLTVQLISNGRHGIVVAGGRLVFAGAGKRTIALKLTRGGRVLLKRSKHLNGTLTVSFTPRGRARSSVTQRVSLSK